MATLKGVWVFNELTLETHEGFVDVSINFTSNGLSFIGMQSFAYPIEYLQSDGSPVYALKAWYWTDEAYRTVDFGETEQPVDDAFYAWFIANSKPLSYVIKADTLKGIASAIREKLNTTAKYTPTEMPQAIRDIRGGGDYQQGYDTGYAEGYTEGYTEGEEVGKQEATAELSVISKVKGVWLFNESLELQTMGQALRVDVPVNFSSAGIELNEMKADSNGLFYSGEEMLSVYNGNAWVDEAYRTVDFGATEQDVPVEFFVWLLANAADITYMTNYQSDLNGDYEAAFSNAAWNDNNYNPVMDIVATKSAVNAFRKSAITNTKKPIYLNCSLATAMFVNSAIVTIPYIYFGEKLTDTGTFTNGAKDLEEITVIDGKIRTGINFSASTKLNEATLERIKNALADRREESTTTKLTLNKVFKDLFISKGWDVEITNKNWQIAWGS